MFGRTVAKQFQPPQGKQMDEATQALNDFALEFAEAGRVQYWNGDSSTGEYDYVQIARCEDGVIASAWADRK